MPSGTSPMGATVANLLLPTAPLGMIWGLKRRGRQRGGDNGADATVPALFDTRGAAKYAWIGAKFAAVHKKREGDA